MSDIFLYALIAVAGYLLGNFTTGTYVAKLVADVDIRKVGSGNPGTTNVLRTLGWLPSLLTLLGDMAKGALAAGIGMLLLGDIGARVGGVCAVIGHNWPVFAGFKGGKGVAASLGAILVVDPWLALACIGVQVALIAITRYMSVASLAALALYLLLTVILRWNSAGHIAFAVILAALTVFCHRENLQRLRAGTENRLDFGKINKASKGRRK